ncbi:DUF1415 domain-containing protein [Caenimonas terrae]|uniref:DUF1415 domain-containing protein n=1 Tax=Caenimonas terrae TaxID=696074 RepID=A0ABW0NJ70_9BURK
MPGDDAVIGATRRWLERAVIGLNLCPFAKAVHARGQVHFAVSAADSPASILDDLARELDGLVARDARERDTTLLIVPHCLELFLDFNDVVARGERMIRKKGLEGVIQLASFHPHFCFADSSDDDVTNFSNRSPYPTLHLLREASIDKAVRAFPDAEAIYGANLETLRKLGAEGWAALDVGPAR